MPFPPYVNEPIEDMPNDDFKRLVSAVRRNENVLLLELPDDDCFFSELKAVLERSTPHDQLDFLRQLRGRKRILAIAKVKWLTHDTAGYGDKFQTFTPTWQTDIVEYGGIRMPWPMAKSAYELYTRGAAQWRGLAAAGAAFFY